MKNINIIAACMLGVASLGITSCGDVADEITSIVYDRYFSPTDLTAKVRNRTNIEVSWKAVNGASQYVVEVYSGSDESGTKVVEQTTTETTVLVTGLEGETSYYVRVKATGESNNESKWNGATATTDAEQIAKAVNDDEITAKSVVIRWTAGETVTTITLTPGDITHNVTADEIAAGAATIEGLTPETEYSVVLKNGEKTRGSISFKTLIDFGDATPLYADDDINAALDAAADGASFILVDPVEYNIGKYELTKSVTIQGYKPSYRPTIKGMFVVNGSVSSVTLKNLIVDGKGGGVDGADATSLLDLTDASASIGSFTVSGCKITNMSQHIIYNNVKAKIGDVTFDDCVIDNCAPSGGDGFDLRGGNLNNLIVTNTTVMNGCRSMVRGQAAGNYRFEHCTFYNICTSDDSNNSGLFRVEKSTLTTNDLLIVNVGPQGVDALTNKYSGTWGRSDKNKTSEQTNKAIVYYNSPFLWTQDQADTYTSFAKEIDPKFKDAENGDLTIGNEDLKAGDPRWY